MTDNESADKKELFKQLEGLKLEIKDLRDRLNDIDSEKEKWFEKKEEFHKQVLSLIGKAKTSKSQRNTFTSTVKKAKDERHKAIAELKGKRDALNKLKDEKSSLISKLNIKEDPSKMKAMIEKLEFDVETNVMSFDKEQKIMKKIKDLKKKYGEMKGVSDIWDGIRALTKEIRELNRKANEKHKVVQQAAQQSQHHHEDCLESGKQIDDLKEKEEEYFQKFMEFKKQFNEVNDTLKEKLTVLNDLNQKLNIVKQERKKAKQDKIEEVMKTKEENVNEKIKRGDKLTTEDLLILQRNELKS